MATSVCPTTCARKCAAWPEATTHATSTAWRDIGATRRCSAGAPAGGRGGNERGAHSGGALRAAASLGEYSWCPVTSENESAYTAELAVFLLESDYWSFCWP